MPWRVVRSPGPEGAGDDLDLRPAPEGTQVVRTRPASSVREYICDRVGLAVDGDRAGSIVVGPVRGGRQGVQGDRVVGVVDAFTSWYDAFSGWGRRVPRDHRYPVAGIGIRRDFHPDWCHARDLPGRVRGGYQTWRTGDLHGDNPVRRPLVGGGF